MTTVFCPVKPALEQAKCQPLCACGCHPFKKCVNFDHLHCNNKGNRQVTHKSASKFMKCISQSGCQGHVDEDGNRFPCLQKEHSEKMMDLFSTANGLGLSSVINFKFRFLMGCHCDHDDVAEKKDAFCNRSTNEQKNESFYFTMDICTLR